MSSEITVNGCVFDLAVVEASGAIVVSTDVCFRPYGRLTDEVEVVT